LEILVQSLCGARKQAVLLRTFISAIDILNDRSASAAMANEQTKDLLRQEAHSAPPKYLEVIFLFMLTALYVRDDWSDSTQPSYKPRGFSPAPNGLRYRRLGRRRIRNGNLPKLRTNSKNAQSPSRPVHAVLGAL
jgi:hypothetical protein